MKKPKEKKIKTPAEKASAPRPTGKQNKNKTGDTVEELFGVHIISDEDIENHFGTSEDKSSGEIPNENAPTGKSQK